MTGPYLVKIGIDLYMIHKEGASTTWLGRRLLSDPWHGITQLAVIYIVALCLQYLFEFVQTYLMQWSGRRSCSTCAATSSATCSAAPGLLR